MCGLGCIHMGGACVEFGLGYVHMWVCADVLYGLRCIHMDRCVCMCGV